MAYIALYRKWRPKTFADLVGQEHVSKTLSQAIVSGRIGHAYLFAGPRGTGKTSTAKILAKALNCAHGPTPEPCGTCDNCRKITDGSSMDVFEIDAASNRGIDEIRGLRETVKFAPAEGRYKVYIIDEVHMLTAEAFNALLKTLEEPPAHVVFILATTEAHKVPATIQSRCQRYDFRRITVSEIKGRLRTICDAMQTEAADDALELIALQADGGLRDALSILDQCISLADGPVTAALVQEMLGLVGHSWIYRMTDAIASHDAQSVLSIVAELLAGGKDLKQMMAELALHLRSLMIYQAAGTVEGLDLYAEPEDVLKKQAAFFPGETIMAMLARLHEGVSTLRWSPQPRITVEVTLLALCRGRLGGSSAAADASPAPAASAAESAGDAQLIARLEAQIARLSAALAAVPQTAAPQAQPAAAPAPQRSAASAPASPAAAQPAGSPARAAAPAPLSAAPQAQASAEDAAAWQKVIDTFRSQHKQSTLACITQGRIRGFTGGQCFLEFPTETLAQLTLRIYKKQVEEVLASVFGHPMQLVCSAAEAAAPAPPPPPPKKRERPALPPLPHEEKPVEVDISALPADEQKSLQNAVSILGDNFIEPPEMPPQATQAAPQEPSSAPPEQEPQQPQKQPPQESPHD